VSVAAVRRLFQEAARRYDIVLVDTGPILGSLEASIVAAEADTVVVAVSRGEQRVLARRALEYLDAIGARVSGVVFNRAGRGDMMSHGFSSSAGPRLTSIGRDSGSRPAPTNGAGNGHAMHVGPLASAVASSTSTPAPGGLVVR
jgi:hypothetical protein